LKNNYVGTLEFPMKVPGATTELLRRPSAMSVLVQHKHLTAVKRLRKYLPWRVQQALSVASYIRPLTQYIFRKILDTPPLSTDPSSPLDVLSLLDAPNVNNYLLAIKSLLLNLPRRPSVTVLSDGTLRSNDMRTLEQHILGVRVLARDEIDIPHAAASAIRSWCDQNPLMAKLLYLPFSTEKPIMIVLDSDVIIRRRLPEQFANPAPEVTVAFNHDHDHSLHDPCFRYLEEYAAMHQIRLIKNLNSGLMVWRRSQLRPLEAVEFLNHVVHRHGSLHLLAEQDAWALLASQFRTEPLPIEFLVLCNWEYNNRVNRRRAIAVHYVSGERYRRLDYLRDGLRIIRRLKYPLTPKSQP
jgi:hypothetical protein